MITVKYFHRKNRYAMSFEGHAEYAPIGRDIVCAGVSSLMYALANHVQDYAQENNWVVLEVNLDDKNKANIEILDESNTVVAENLYNMVFEQIKDIAESYPLNVKAVC